jgi:transposase
VEDRLVNKKYVVDLTDVEREQLVALTSKGTTGVRRYKRAQALLGAAVGETDAAIGARVGLHHVTIEGIRKRFVEEGLEAALSERPRPGAARKLDGRGEAHLLALACSAPPGGRTRWTMQLLANRLVERKLVDAISDETVRRTLKRGTSSRGSTRPGASRPSRTPSSSPGWRTSWISTRNHPIPSARRSASTSCPTRS